MLKKSFLLITMLLLVFNVFACGKKEISNANKDTSLESEVETTADEDGNVEAIVNIKDATFHKTMSHAWKKETISKKEQKNMDAVLSILNSVNLEVDDKLFECSYGDIESDISVWSLEKSKEGTSLDNYGIIIRLNENNFAFEDVCHGKNPQVDVDEDNNLVYIAGGVMEGTGTHTDALYVFKIENDEVKNIAFVDPYDVVNYFVDNMTYDVNVDDIKFKLNKKVISEVTNSVDGQGVLRGISLGEQITYEFDDDHNIKVNVTPGVKFGTTSYLFYDDMPTFEANVKIKDGKAEFSNIKLEE